MRKILYLLASLFGVVLGLALLIWIFPGIILNNTTLGFARSFLGKKQIGIEWKEADLKASSESFTRKKVSVDFSGLCANLPEMGIKGCFKELKGEVVAGFDGAFRVFRLGPLRAVGGEVDIDLQQDKKETKPEEEESGGFSFPQLPPELDRVEIAVERWSLKSGDFQGRGTLFLTDVSPETHRYALESDTILQSAGGPEQKVRARVAIWPSKEKWEVEGVAGYQQAKRDVEIRFAAATGKDGHRLEWQGLAKNLDKSVQRVAFEKCRLDLDQKGGGQRLKLNCPLSAKLALPGPTDLPVAKLVEELDVLLDIELARKSEDDPVKGEVRMGAEPLFRTLGEGKGMVSLKVDGRVQDTADKWNYELDSEFSLEHFEKITRFLQGTAWAVPEPFNSLKGQVIVHVKGKGSLDSGYGTFPVNLQTKLHSATQRFDVRSENKLVLAKEGNALEANVKLDDVRLVLPHLDLKKPPRIAPDPRIHRGGEEKRAVAKVETKTPKMKMRVEVRTPGEKPVRLVSNLAKRDIPLRVNFDIPESGKMHGEVHVSEFPMDLFRRNAKVEYFRVKLHPNPEDNEVEGKIVVSYVDYTITLEILGLLDRPVVEMYSEPPLPEKQVLAVLLFGRNLEELDSDSADSVGNTQAAVADGAIGLASLYALASTPIESVGYDSRTRTFTAKVRLADGTSLNIGSDLKEVNQIGIRKRLTSRWSLNTYLENPFTSAQRSLTTALEWSFRY